MRFFFTLAAAGLLAAASTSAASAQGADVIVGGIPSIEIWGASGGTAGYSLATTSCNIGTAELLWIRDTNQHPVIGQNIYREENGRFEQIGMGWLKHGFFALQQNLCGTCQNANAGGTRLGIGCSDPYGANLNGQQNGLGPRFQVNAFSGDFPYPFFGQGQTGDRSFKRVQVQNDDVDPSLHPQAQYYGEAQYITPDDAAAGNGFNNNSYVALSRPGSTSQGAFRLNIGGPTVRERSAIYGWAASNPNVTLEEINVPGEGQFVAGSNAVDNGDGTWTYNYAIFNNNSDFSGRSFSIQVGDAPVIDMGMSFPMYHSGEPYTNLDWTTSVTGGLATWSTENFSQNQDANALRWGTMYSFWFTSDAAPTTRVAQLELFKPGNPGAQTVALDGPNGAGGTTVFTSNYCQAVPNSTLVPTGLGASNFDLTARTFDLEVTDLPTNVFGMVVTSLSDGFIANPGFSAGNLCLSGQIGRSVGGALFNSGTSGTSTLPVNMDVISTPNGPTSIMAGETRYFQAWHRDVTGLGTPTSNYSVGLRTIFP